jgi:glycyl-tRNA synthetase beta chain
MKRDDFLVEVLTEELPPKSLIKLGQAFGQQIQERLQKAELAFTDLQFFATPRRLAVLVKDLAATQPTQRVERKGPAVNAAFDAAGKPTQACIGFARSCGISPDELQTIKTEQGEWVGYTQVVEGKSVKELLPQLIEQALFNLPVARRMRWGASEVQFVRPVQAIILLYGDEIIPATICGCEAGRITRGHRFHAGDWLTVPNASAYPALMKTAGHVIVDVNERRELVKAEADASVKQKLKGKGKPYISSAALLDEVTGLVEWPVALCGEFDAKFLDLPEEVLISSMQDHQRYFPVKDEQGKLLPYFITMSNIQSKDVSRVVHGNERVLRARLSDAAFFYATDKKGTLESRIPLLKGIVFQAKLGSLYDKAERVSLLAEFLAQKMQVDTKLAVRAAMLAKTDLTTNMVSEFPELQGVMGCYYAQNDGEPTDVQLAMNQQYMPRFAGDKLPTNPIGKVLALADRIDTLAGAFGSNQIPTGDKDPFGLRRAAIGVLRILIEEKIDLDLQEALKFTLQNFKVKLENPDVVTQVVSFIQERLRAWYQDQGVTPDVFAAVVALSVTNPLDIHKRILAVQAFKKLSAAESLSVANKRVSNILTKYLDAIEAKQINPALFESEVESKLAERLEIESLSFARYYDKGDYDNALRQLAELRQPIDDFFEHVLVMTEDKSRRENRILLLGKLRTLFLQVADIALLQ